MLAQLAIAGVDVLTDAYFFIVTLIKSAKSSKRKVGIQRFTNCLLNHVFKHNYISRSSFFIIPMRVSAATNFRRLDIREFRALKVRGRKVSGVQKDASSAWDFPRQSHLRVHF